MDGDTYIRVGDGPFIPCSEIKNPLPVREDDLLTVRVIRHEEVSPPEIYLEDYRLSLKDELVFVDGQMAYETEGDKYFKESFGYAFVRIDYTDEHTVVPFDVLIRESNAKRAQEMLEYISSQNFNILKSCFSRSSRGVDMLPDAETDPEAMISQAEKILGEFQRHRDDFFRNLRQRLVPALVPAWSVSHANVDVDPYNVINNIDSLIPAGAGSGQVFVKGRHYDFSSADIMSLQSSSDVYENRVVLGGFYSIRRKIQGLRKELSLVDIDETKPFYGYESFSRLKLQLTAQGMLSRCDKVLLACDQCIGMLEKKHGIAFSGEIRPSITPFIRASKTYRKVFTLFAGWYQLGRPHLEGINFLMKLKSLSRLYEIFTMIKLLEYCNERGWAIEDADSHEDLGNTVPSYVKLSLNGVVMKLYYEKKVSIYDEHSTNHLDIIDTYHRPSHTYPYWTPDFLIRLEEDDNVKYLILDAKYSSQSTVRIHSIRPLYEKYYEHSAVYDRHAGVMQNSRILCVMAIHALPDKGSNYFSLWPYKGIYSKVPKIPMVGGVALSTDSAHNFNDVLDKVFEISRRVRC